MNIKKEVPTKRVDREEFIANQNKENNRSVVDEIIHNSVALFLLFLTVVMISYTLTKEERTTLIENLIIVFLCIGMVLSKKR